MIEVTGIKKAYRMGSETVHALRDVTLSIAPGEFVAIMGPSGSGKSTLMHILGLLDIPDQGSYRLRGRQVAHLPVDELAALRARSIGFVFQQFNLLPRVSALENVALPFLYSGEKPDMARARSLLGEVGLAERAAHKPNELSGGQQQRVAIARALVNNPHILFADEPTGNLDSASERDIMRLFQDLNRRGITVVLVTHEDEIAGYAKRVIRMRDGHIQSDERIGTPAAGAPASTRPPEPAAVDGRTTGSIVREVADHGRQALRALLSNKVRSALSMLGVLIGVAAVIAILSLGAGAQQAVEERLSSLGSNLLTLRPGRTRGIAREGGAPTRFTQADANAIAASVPAVRRTAATVSGNAQVVYGNKNTNTSILGTTPSYAGMRAAEPAFGRFFTESENVDRRRVAVVGMTVVRELFDGQNPIGAFIKINRINFQIVGVLPEKGSSGWRDADDIVIIPLNTAMKRLLGKDYVDAIDIEIAGPDLMASAQAQIERLVMRRHRLPPAREESFRIRNMAEIQDALSETSRTMTLLLTAVAAISLLVGGIGIMNIMLVSVTERTREIGLRKAIGAKRRDILGQFMVEAVVTSGVGGLAGAAIGACGTIAMARFAGWAVSIPVAGVALAVIFSVTIGVVFGIWPAQKASRLHPIEALRYE